MKKITAACEKQMIQLYKKRLDSVKTHAVLGMHRQNAGKAKEARLRIPMPIAFDYIGKLAPLL